jgi:hypothetical protein
MAKSGHRGRNLSRCSSARSASRSFRTQAASGARVAPFGNLNPVEKSKIIPVSFSKAQLLNCITRTAFRAPVLPLAGDIIMRSPLMAQNSSSWSSVISTAGHMCSTSGSVGTVYVALFFDENHSSVLYCYSLSVQGVELLYHMLWDHDKSVSKAGISICMWNTDPSAAGRRPGGPGRLPANLCKRYGQSFTATHRVWGRGAG